MVRRTSSVVALAAASLSCGSGTAGPPPGAVLFVEPDLSGATDDVVFAAVPDLLVTVDGTVIFGAPDDFAIQGELIPDVWAQMLSAAGVEMVQRSVDEGTAPASIDELRRLVGAELGSTQFYLPDAYRFRAAELGPESAFVEPDMPLIAWPDSVTVSLAEATNCVTLPELEVGELLETAAADSAFVDEGIVYDVVSAQDWPGAPC